MGAPVAASTQLLAAAFGENGRAVQAGLVDALRSSDKAKAEQAARTLKKIAEADRAMLLPLRKRLLREAFRATEVRVQWNLTIAIGRLPLTGGDKAVAVDLMFERLSDSSGLNRTFALQALMDLSEDDAALRARVLPFVHKALADGTPAMKARARKLLGMSRKGSQ
jgi:hypothetical protein